MSLIIKEVFADAVNQKLGMTLKMGQLADDVTDSVAEITECGDTIDFPKYERVAKAGEITKGTALVPKEVSMTGNKAKIKHTGDCIRVYDKDAKQIKGNTQDAMAQQLADAMAVDLDTSLSESMLAKATKKSATASKFGITAEEVFNGLALFGDDMDTDRFKGMAINSRLLPSFLKMPEFTGVEKTYQANGNGLIKNGLVGYFIGIPVYLTNHGTWDTEKSECVTFIVQKGALGYVKQKDVSVEIEREAKLFANDIVCDSLYATQVLDADGIVIMKNTVA